MLALKHKFAYMESSFPLYFLGSVKSDKVKTHLESKSRGWERPAPLAMRIIWKVVSALSDSETIECYDNDFFLFSKFNLK